MIICEVGLTTIVVLVAMQTDAVFTLSPEDTKEGNGRDFDTIPRGRNNKNTTNF